MYTLFLMDQDNSITNAVYEKLSPKHSGYLIGFH